LISDFEAYYQRDLLDVYRQSSGLSPRRVLWLVEHLPPDSAFRASMQGGNEFRGWTQQTYLLAATVNLLNAANRQRAGKKTKGPLVKPPSSANRSKVRRVTVAEIAKRQQRQIELANN